MPFTHLLSASSKRVSIDAMAPASGMLLAAVSSSAASAAAAASSPIAAMTRSRLFSPLIAAAAAAAASATVVIVLRDDGLSIKSDSSEYMYEFETQVLQSNQIYGFN